MKYTFDQYVKMAERFNRKTFYEKIAIIRENQDILSLGSDGNWWAVMVKDEAIQEQLSEADISFDIENEWGHRQIGDLLNMLGIIDVGL